MKATHEFGFREFRGGECRGFPGPWCAGFMERDEFSGALPECRQDIPDVKERSMRFRFDAPDKFPGNRVNPAGRLEHEIRGEHVGPHRRKRRPVLRGITPDEFHECAPQIIAAVVAVREAAVLGPERPAILHEL